MKVVFVGPSLPDAALFAGGITIHPPAIQGDIGRAVEAGATSIGLIDGGFEYQPPIWHKEILHGLSIGVRIFGASSMGALRAAECADFGMVCIGDIAEGFSTGRFIDDADVALLHGPAELNYPALTVPMVNILATLDALQGSGELDAELRARIEAAARSVFFKERTWKKIIEASGCDPGILPLLKARFVDVKRRDALMLMASVQNAPDSRDTQVPAWRLNQPFLAGAKTFP